MEKYEKVRSSTKPQNIEITKDKVFIAENIKEYEELFDDVVMSGFEYDYICYSKDEYIKYIAETNIALQADLLNTQLALCDIYEELHSNI